MTDVIEEVSEDRAMVLTSKHAPIVELIRELQAEVSEDGPANDAFVLDLMSQILQAETWEDVFAAQEQGMVSGKDFAGVPFLLRGDQIKARPSSARNIRQGGFTHYYILERITRLDTGEETTINCGGKTFVPVLSQLRRTGYFDPDKGCPTEGRAFIITATETDEGAYLKLLPFKQPTVSGKRK